MADCIHWAALVFSTFVLFVCDCVSIALLHLSDIHLKSFISRVDNIDQSLLCSVKTFRFTSLYHLIEKMI